MEIERHGEAVVVRLHGRVTQREAGRVERALLDRVEEGVVRIVMDISDVPLISSAGLGALMAAYKACKPKGGCVRLVGTQPLVRQVLGTTKLSKLLRSYDSVSEALAAT